MTIQRIARCSSLLSILLLYPEIGDAQAACTKALMPQMAAYRKPYTATGNPNVWKIAFTGTQLTNYTVVVATGESLVVAFVDPLVKKARVPLTADFLLRLLRDNYDFDRVKIGIDKDGDLFVRADFSCDVSEREFAIAVDQVGAVANELYGKIESDLLRE